MKRIILEGTSHKNNLGEEFHVLEHIGGGWYTIEFQDEYKHRTTALGLRILEGRPKNPYYKGFNGTGYIGYGPYVSSSSGREAYLRWQCIWRRIGRPDEFPTYANCSVGEEWHNFQNFASWFYNNQYRYEGWVIDKDIICPGNKIYSPEFCAFVPEEINAYFTSKSGAKTARGVVKDRHGKFVANLKNSLGKHRLGYFTTEEEAYACYVEAKNKEASRLADKWESLIDPRIVESLRNFDFRESFEKLKMSLKNGTL